MSETYFGPAPDFKTKGNCREADPEVFFGPDVAEEDNRFEYESRDDQRFREFMATRYCLTCPALYRCAQWALEHEEFGVWGALTEDDRIVLGGKGVRLRPGPAPSWKRLHQAMRDRGIPEPVIDRIVAEWQENPANPANREDDEDEREVA